MAEPSQCPICLGTGIALNNETLCPRCKGEGIITGYPCVTCGEQISFGDSCNTLYDEKEAGYKVYCGTCPPPKNWEEIALKLARYLDNIERRVGAHDDTSLRFDVMTETWKRRTLISDEEFERNDRRA